ncbi:MAG: hypothetical protein WC588_00155 [Candidatus Micrarchaeia archaeon]
MIDLSDSSVVLRLAVVILLPIFAIIYFYRKKIRKDLETLNKRKQGDLADAEQGGPLVAFLEGCEKILRFVAEYLREFREVMFKKKQERKKPEPVPPS